MVAAEGQQRVAVAEASVLPSHVLSIYDTALVPSTGSMMRLAMNSKQARRLGSDVVDTFPSMFVHLPVICASTLTRLMRAPAFSDRPPARDEESTRFDPTCATFKADLQSSKYVVPVQSADRGGNHVSALDRYGWTASRVPGQRGPEGAIEGFRVLWLPVGEERRR